MIEAEHSGNSDEVVLSRPSLVGTELVYLSSVVASRDYAGPGKFSAACERILAQFSGARRALVVPSCTAALEMGALLLELAPGDEVIMPSFTFVSTANAVVLRGATPVFVDVDAVTFNIDPEKVRAAITKKAKAVFVVHYAGVPADMDRLSEITKEHGIEIVEDAAQAFGSYLNNKPAGSFAPLACYSFHGTKNISAGEAGALIVNDPNLVERANVLREKGTDRSRFLTGEVPFYAWQDVGSSQIVSEFTSAVLLAQLEKASQINADRMVIWQAYLSELTEIASSGLFSLPSPPSTVRHNAHIFFLVMKNRADRSSLANYLRQYGIQSAPHYVPLHSSPAGKRFGRVSGSVAHTKRAAECLLRLPMHTEMKAAQPRIIAAVKKWAASQL